MLSPSSASESRITRIAPFVMWWALWTTIALLNAATQMIQTPHYPKWKPLLWEFSSLYTVGILYPLVARIARRFSFSKEALVRTLALHTLFLLVFSAAHTSGMVAIRTIGYWVVGQSYEFGGSDRVLYEFYKDVILYFALVGLTRGIDYYRKSRESELRSEQLQRRLIEAKLQNLRGQLNPHFLFNTLNMISARMYEDVPEADRMITRLSDLLRMTLRSSDEPEVPLKNELDMLNLYLEIMKARFAESIRVDLSVDPKTQNVMVPTLLLQPLVENAFRHGAGCNVEGGRIEVITAAHNGTVSIIVRDDGPGIAGDPKTTLQKGFGLSNTAERLRQLYGDQHQLRIHNRPASQGGGLEVAIEIPARSNH